MLNNSKNVVKVVVIVVNNVVRKWTTVAHIAAKSVKIAVKSLANAVINFAQFFKNVVQKLGMFSVVFLSHVLSFVIGFVNAWLLAVRNVVRCVIDVVHHVRNVVRIAVRSSENA